MCGKIKGRGDLNVYKLSFAAGVQIYEITKTFPKEELFSLTSLKNGPGSRLLVSSSPRFLA